MNNNLERMINYFRQGETKNQSIGTEFEHLIVRQDNLATIAFEDNGIEELLFELAKQGWTKVEEGKHLIGLKKNEAEITVEPGGQFEVSIYPREKISEIKKIYTSFLADIKAILAEKEYYILTLGYQPESKISDITWNPKKRYKIMSSYLEKRGDCSHNMMKGTASFQVAFDYKDQTDFNKKVTIFNALSPLLAIISDNSPFFEGEVFKNNALRTYIWDETDPIRTGIIKDALISDFSYRDYAEFILNSAPILIKKDGEYLATNEKKVKDIYQEESFSKEELDHILTMVFPDVRVKDFIEIRMMDAITPDLSFALLAFLKGLIYDQQNLDKLFNYVNRFSADEVINLRKDILLEGLSATIQGESMLEMAQKLILWSKSGLSFEEAEFLKPLEKNLKLGLNPALKIKKEFGESKDKKSVLNDSILNFWKGD